MKKQIVALFALAAMLLSGCTQPQKGDADAGAVTAGYDDRVVTRVASLKGPTSMGLADLMTSDNTHYSFSIHASADEIVPLIVKGDVDIALVPANLAATLYQKTDGNIEVLNVNTLGVLEVVTPIDTEMQDLSAMKGKTIYMTGKGTTPESSLRYLAEKNNIKWEDMQIEFKTEPTEVVSALKADPDAFAVLPQPFATVATQQMRDKHIALSLGEEWNRVTQGQSQLVTGVTIARKPFVQECPGVVLQFAQDAADSVQFVNENVEAASQEVDTLGIVKAPVAKLAIPRCNLVSLTGEEMKTALSGYLETLYQYDPNLVGGQLPDDSFYGA